MLGFYGIQLVNRETGEVKRADNSKERFGNLERYVSIHRISQTALILPLIHLKLSFCEIL